MTRVAAIDCGTNSLRLLIADVDASRGTLVDVDREMNIVRLGQGVDRTRRFADDALERTFAVCRDYAERIDAQHVERVREREVVSLIKISDVDIDNLIEKRRAAAGTNAQIDVAQILVTVPEGAGEAAVAERRARGAGSSLGDDAATATDVAVVEGHDLTR